MVDRAWSKLDTRVPLLPYSINRSPNAHPIEEVTGKALCAERIRSMAAATATAAAAASYADDIGIDCHMNRRSLSPNYVRTHAELS